MDVDRMIDDALLEFVTTKTNIEVDSKAYRQLRVQMAQAVRNAVEDAIKYFVQTRKV